MTKRDTFWIGVAVGFVATIVAYWGYRIARDDLEAAAREAVAKEIDDQVSRRMGQ